MLRPVAALDGCKKAQTLRPLGSPDGQAENALLAQRTLLNAQLRGLVVELQRQLTAATITSATLQAGVDATTAALAQLDSHGTPAATKDQVSAADVATAKQRTAALTSKTTTLDLEIADLSRHLDRLTRKRANTAATADTIGNKSLLVLVTARHVELFVREHVRGTKSNLGREWTTKDIATLTDVLISHLPLQLELTTTTSTSIAVSPKTSRKTPPCAKTGELPQVEKTPSPRRRRPRSDSVGSGSAISPILLQTVLPVSDELEPAQLTPPSSANANKLSPHHREHRRASSERIRRELLTQETNGGNEELDALVLPGLLGNDTMVLPPDLQHARTPRPGGLERSPSRRQVQTETANTIEKSLHPVMRRAGSRVIRDTTSPDSGAGSPDRPSLTRRPSSKHPLSVPVVDERAAAVMPVVHPVRHVTADEMEHVPNIALRRGSLRGSTLGIRTTPPVQEPPSPPKPAKSIPRLAMVEPFELVDLCVTTDQTPNDRDSAPPTLTPATSRTDMEIQISPPRPHFESLNLSLSHAVIMRDTPRPEPEEVSARSSVDGSMSQRSSPPRLTPLHQTATSNACFNTSRVSPPKPLDPPTGLATSSPVKQRTSKHLARIIPSTTAPMDTFPPLSFNSGAAGLEQLLATPPSGASFLGQSTPSRRMLGTTASVATSPLKASPPKQPTDSPAARTMEKSPSASRRGLFPSTSRPSMEPI
ncbi:hypothetical protein H257_09327 [Aphanomyces astaci]|uniref:Uncharacterized protein n=1 Tax=Aphanomyces astaci TaxID=112090 RepID=W4GCT2_APHAT|nr:hypothetical protein H257_09327 [Aphanomyces astaci]ETV76889.1 hypothetical protein H257_09327 [Aphanomyces astaci]|eukprot:XP_009833801.1 hypothetical protein H257_09327 [Aphanomyces astaci]